MNDRPTSPPLYYDALKVSQDAPAEVIRAAYRSLSQKYHPDRNAADDCARVMAALNEAYEVLSHPLKKQQYDSWIRQEGFRAGAGGRDESARKQLVTRRRPRLHNASRRSRIVAGISALACCAAVVAYSASQNTDPWLERAWQESWRNDARGSDAGQSTLVRFGQAGAAVEAGAAPTPALRWESGLKNPANQSGPDVQF